MTITQEKTGDLQAVVRVTLAREDYEQKVNDSIKKLAKRVDIKGFRPGMVPMPVVRKMYGNSVLAEELNRELNDRMWEYIKAENLSIIGQPIPTEDQPLLDTDINALKDVQFSYEIGLTPEVDLNYLDNSPTFEKLRIQIEESEIDSEVDRLRKRFADYEYPDTAEMNDILSFTIEELHEDGTIKTDGISTVSSIMPDMLKPEAQATILALKKHDHIDVNIWEILLKDREGIAKNILNLPDVSKADEVGDQYRLTLNNITRSKPAELNEEFFTKVYGPEGPKTEAAMRDTIRKDIEAYYDGHTDNYLINELYKAIMASVAIPMPEPFLKRWLVRASEKPLTDEEIEKEFPILLKQLRWQLITGKISKENSFEVTEAEIKESIRRTLLQQFYSYGLGNLGDDFIETFVVKQLADKEAVRKAKEQIHDDKVMAYIKSKVKLVDKPTTVEEYRVLNEAAANA